MPNERCRCPSCGKQMTVPDDILGERARCPACRRTLLVRAVGGETTSRPAGVSGDAPTAFLPGRPAADSSPTLSAPPESVGPRRSLRPLACGALLVGPPLLACCAGLVGAWAWRQLPERPGGVGPAPSRLESKAPARGGVVENKEADGTVVPVELTDDQKAAWRKFRKKNLEMPVRVLGCLPRSQGRQSFDEVAFGRRASEDEEDCWHFAYQGRIFIDGPRIGEDAAWADRAQLGTAYYSPSFVTKFEDTALFREMKAERAKEEKGIAERQRRRDERSRPRGEEERRFMERELGKTIEQYNKEVNAEEMDELRKRFDEAIRREKESFAGQQYSAALRRAEGLALRTEVKAIAVADLFTGDQPRVLRWYWNDGKETKSSATPPSQPRGKGLERFLGSLMRHAGDL